jgi:HSP20 family protein
MARSPFAPVFSLRRDIDRLFDEAFGGGEAGGVRNGEVWMPPANIREAQNELRIELELPGVSPDRVDVSVDKGILTISGEKREERKEGDEGRWHLVERRYGTFARSFSLPQGTDEEQIGADFRDGVLSVRIPKLPAAQPRRIQVGRGEGAPAQRRVEGKEPARAEEMEAGRAARGQAGA